MGSRHMNTHCWGTKYSLHVFGQRLYFTHRILKCILVEGLIRARGGAYASNNFKNGAYFGNYPDSILISAISSNRAPTHPSSKEPGPTSETQRPYLETKLRLHGYIFD